MPYYKGNILSSARFFLQKDEFFFSIASHKERRMDEKRHSSNPE